MEVQSKALGFDPAVIFVPHPIQNRTAEELNKLADDIVEPALRMLTATALREKGDDVRVTI